MRLVGIVGLLFSVSMLTSCIFEKAGTATLKSQSSTKLVEASISEDGQEVSGTLSASSGEVQTLSAPAGSSISGIQTSFPPGAISVDTQIFMAPGANITSLDEIAAIGLGQGNQVQQVGNAVSIESSVAFNAAVPFSVAISLAEAGLHLQDDFNNFAVVYKVKDVDANAVKYGVIPAGEITIVNGKAIFSTRYFGTYQLIKTEAPVIARQEAKVATLVADSPAIIHDTMPMIADGGRQVTLHGKGFTGKTVITIAGLPVRQFNVRSDVQASFVVPDKVPFGFTTVEAEQAGVKNSYPLLARSADKLSLPLITMEPSGVCAGISYYDANGVQQKGTKACDGGGPGSKAGYADSAGYADVAGEASFARGKKGGSVTAAANVQLPSNGDVFDVLGSSTIRNFGVGGEGQIVKVFFRNEVLVAGNQSHPKLILAEGLPFAAGPGSLLMLIGTGDGWREIGRDHPLSQPAAFVGVIGVTGVSRAGAANPTDPLTAVTFDHVTVDPAHFSFQNGILTTKLERNYRIEAVFSVDHNDSTESFSCRMVIKDGPATGTELFGGAGMPGAKIGQCVFDNREHYAATLRITGQPNTEFKFYFTAESPSITSGTYRLRSRPGVPVVIKLYPEAPVQYGVGP